MSWGCRWSACPQTEAPARAPADRGGAGGAAGEDVRGQGGAPAGAAGGGGRRLQAASKGPARLHRSRKAGRSLAVVPASARHTMTSASLLSHSPSPAGGGLQGARIQGCVRQRQGTRPEAGGAGRAHGRQPCKLQVRTTAVTAQVWPCSCLHAWVGCRPQRPVHLQLPARLGWLPSAETCTPAAACTPGLAAVRRDLYTCSCLHAWVGWCVQGPVHLQLPAHLGWLVCAGTCTTAAALSWTSSWAWPSRRAHWARG